MVILQLTDNSHIIYGIIGVGVIHAPTFYYGDMRMTTLVPIKDLLAEILDEVTPFFIFRIGTMEFQCWKPDHIAEAHNLRYVSSQVELMVLGQQYQLLVKRLNDLSVATEISANEQIEINNITQKMGEAVKAMLPLNASYIEALTESKPGILLTILKAELGKKNLNKDVPLALIINSIREQINDALEKSTPSTESDDMGKETTVTTESELKLISEGQ